MKMSAICCVEYPYRDRVEISLCWDERITEYHGRTPLEVQKSFLNIIGNSCFNASTNFVLDGMCEPYYVPDFRVFSVKERIDLETAQNWNSLFFRKRPKENYAYFNALAKIYFNEMGYKASFYPSTITIPDSLDWA